MLINPANGMQLLNVRGLAFSNLQENLWNITPYDSPTNQHRQNDAGHGVNTVIDGSRGTDIGHSSYHFGRGVGSNYAFNGGAYGSVVTNEFSLEGYSSFDQPVLYFNYFLNADSSLDIPNPPLGPVYYDTFRVFISGVNDDNRDRNADGIADSNSGDWIMLAHDDNLTTNDPLPGTPPPPVADLLRRLCAVFGLPDVAVGRSLLDGPEPGLYEARRVDATPARPAWQRLLARS